MVACGTVQSTCSWTLMLESKIKNNGFISNVLFAFPEGEYLHISLRKFGPVLYMCTLIFMKISQHNIHILTAHLGQCLVFKFRCHSVDIYDPTGPFIYRCRSSFSFQGKVNPDKYEKFWRKWNEMQHLSCFHVIW